jgi:seryl-tRNA synthetase
VSGDFGARAVGGRLTLTGLGAELCRWLDARVRDAALADGAVECRFPASIARDTLARAGYFESFPDGAAPIGNGPEAAYLLSPAVCYHAYALLADRTLEQPALLTAAQTCFREADRAADHPARLWEFTMREVIFLGPPAWVAAQRDAWIARTEALARELGLDGAIEPATDPFFGDLSRGQRLMQQLKHLKDELRLAIGSTSVAAASVNLHETFFGRRFGIALPDGSIAHSGCAAFGLERWALAILAQRGEHGARTLLQRHAS